MKAIFLFIALFIFSSSYSQFTKEEIKSVRTKIGKGVLYKYDRHNEILWVESKHISIDRGSSYFCFYYGLKKINDSIVKLPTRIKSRYHGIGWIFANKVSFALTKYKEEDKGKITKASYSDDNPTRDVYSGGYVQEVLDNVVPSDLIPLLQYAIENKRMVSIRFEGESKYTDMAIFAFSLKGLTPFFNSMNTYSTLKK